MTNDPLRLVVLLGRDARHRWLATDLDYPPSAILRKYTTVIADNPDLYRLQGYMADEVRYIPAEPTPHMWEYMRARGHTIISFAEAKQWIRSKYTEIA